MEEPYYEYYKIDLGQIWQYEAELYLEGGNSDDFISKVKSRYEKLIMYTRRWQLELDQELKNKQEQKDTDSKLLADDIGIIISPFTSTEHYDRGEEEYFLRKLNDYNNCKTIRDYVKLTYFGFQDGFIGHNQTLFAAPTLSDFEFWLALKLKQYTKGLKYISQLCEYNLKHLYDNDFEKFKGVLEISILQYKNEIIPKNIASFVETWIKDYESNKFDQKIAFPIKTWNNETFVNEQVFVINEKNEADIWNELIQSDNNNISELEPTNNYQYSTNLDIKVVDENKEQDLDNSRETDIKPKNIVGNEIITPAVCLEYHTLFDAKFYKFRYKDANDFTMRVSEIIDEFRESDFISGNTKSNRFLDMFTKKNITESHRINWSGTAYSLKQFMKLIASSKIGQELKGLDKWYVCQMLFYVKLKGQHEYGPIKNYLSIQKASKSKNENEDIITQLTNKLIQFHMEL
jgi:hypothetical protein